MLSEGDLQNYVSDKLHEALGMSDKNVVHYLIGLGRKTDNVDKYVKELETVLGDEGNFQGVAKEIWSRIPRKQKLESVNRAKERMAIAQEEENRSYKMLSDSDGDEDIAPVIKPQKAKKKKRKKEENKAKKQDKSSEDEDEDKKRKRDLIERDEFADRLKKKDKERTRNLAEKSDKKAYDEAKKRLRIEEKDQKALVPELRDRARKKYVQGRKVEKIQSLRDDIEEDEKMFDESSLTAREKLERQYKKKVMHINISGNMSSSFFGDFISFFFNLCAKVRYRISSI